MNNFFTAFKMLEKHWKPPVGYTGITCRLVFDPKVDNTRKVWYMAGGHLINIPTHITYSIVVSRNTICIGFLMAKMNRLYIISGDIQNFFLEALTQDKVLFYADEECKSDKYIVFLFIRTLYGLKSSALQFSNYLVETLGNKLGFKSSPTDTDL